VDELGGRDARETGKELMASKGLIVLHFNLLIPQCLCGPGAS